MSVDQNTGKYMFSRHLNEVILAQIKSNDPTLQILQLGTFTYDDLITLSRAIKQNTNLQQIEFPYQHLFSVLTTTIEKNRIELLVKSIHDKIAENLRLHAGFVIAPRKLITPSLGAQYSSRSHRKWIEIAHTAATSRDWSLAFVNQSLSPQDEAFLSSYTTHSIGLSPKHLPEPRDHLLDILKKTVSIVVTTCIVSMIYESIQNRNSRHESKNEAISTEALEPRRSTVTPNRSFSLLPEKLMDVSKLELIESNSYSETSHEGLVVKFHLNHEDPFFVKMTKQAKTNLFGLLKKFTINELNSFLNDTKVSAAEQSFFSALGRGKTLQTAGEEYLRTMESGNFANKMIVTGVKSIAGGVIYAEKIRSNGLLETVVDTAKNFILKKLIADPVSYGLTILLRANPATLGPMIATSIMASLEPTLTGPAWQDEHPVLNSHVPMPLDFNQLLSAPVTNGPVIRPADSVTVTVTNAEYNPHTFCCIT